MGTLLARWSNSGESICFLPHFILTIDHVHSNTAVRGKKRVLQSSTTPPQEWATESNCKVHSNKCPTGCVHCKAIAWYQTLVLVTVSISWILSTCEYTTFIKMYNTKSAQITFKNTFWEKKSVRQLFLPGLGPQLKLSWWMTCWLLVHLCDSFSLVFQCLYCFWCKC